MRRRDSERAGSRLNRTYTDSDSKVLELRLLKSCGSLELAGVP